MLSGRHVRHRGLHALCSPQKYIHITLPQNFQSYSLLATDQLTVSLFMAQKLACEGILGYISVYRKSMAKCTTFSSNHQEHLPSLLSFRTIPEGVCNQEQSFSTMHQQITLNHQWTSPNLFICHQLVIGTPSRCHRISCIGGWRESLGHLSL